MGLQTKLPERYQAKDSLFAYAKNIQADVLRVEYLKGCSLKLLYHLISGRQSETGMHRLSPVAGKVKWACAGELRIRKDTWDLRTDGGM